MPHDDEKDKIKIEIEHVVECNNKSYVMKENYKNFLLDIKPISNIGINNNYKLKRGINVPNRVDTDKYKVLYNIENSKETTENKISMVEITDINEFEKKFNLFRKKILYTNDSMDLPLFLTYSNKTDSNKTDSNKPITSTSEHFNDISAVVTSNSNFHYNVAKICLRFFFENHHNFEINKVLGLGTNILKLNVNVKKENNNVKKENNNVRHKTVDFPINIRFTPPSNRNNMSPPTYNINSCFFFIYAYMHSLFNSNSEFNKQTFINSIKGAMGYGGNTRKRKSRANRKSKKPRKTKTRKNKKRRPTKK